MPIEHHNPEGLFLSGRYTHVVSVENARLLFISGQIAMDESGNIVGDNDLAAQTTQVFENLKTVLKHFDADFGNVVKLTMYIVNFQYEDRSAVVDVLSRYVDSQNPPANTFLGVQSLARPGLMIEIEAVAAVEKS